MIYATFRRDADRIKGFNFIGHAGSAPKGEDLVCCAVSALCINAVNSIKILTDDAIKIVQNEDEGLMDVSFEGEISHDAGVILSSLELGISELAKQYKSYICLKYTEV